MMAPFAQSHAHLGHGEEATEIHGGHMHDFDHDGGAHHDELDHEGEDHSSVVYLSSGAPQQDGGGLMSTLWLPLLYVVTVLILIDPLLRRVWRPLRRAVRLPSQYPPWPPPLRGPPVSI